MKKFQFCISLSLLLALTIINENLVEIKSQEDLIWFENEPENFYLIDQYAAVSSLNTAHSKTISNTNQSISVYMTCSIQTKIGTNSNDHESQFKITWFKDGIDLNQISNSNIFKKY
jgi:hypothetical protein